MFAPLALLFVFGAVFFENGHLTLHERIKQRNGESGLAMSLAPNHAWTNALDILREIMGGDSEQSQREIERRLARFLKKLRGLLEGTGPKEVEIDSLLRVILNFLGEGSMKALYPQYAQGQLYRDTIRQVVSNLARFRKTIDWNAALDEFEGVQSLPMMTIHKSKGLEYARLNAIGTP